MSQQKTTFDKANSFVAIRHHDSEAADCYERIRRLRERIPADASDYRSSVILRACREALGEETGSAGTAFTLREHVIEELKRLDEEQLPRYLFYRYRYDVYPVTKQLDTFPPCLQVEPTSICNYRCVFCYQTDTEFTDRKNGFMGSMTLDMFKSIVDQAQGNCEALTLASRGEPLLCRDIKKMLSYAAGKFLALKINTNAWYLDEANAHAILQADPNTVVFSADAAAEPLYSQLRVRGNLKRVLTNIEAFHNLREREYPKTKLITRVSGVRYTESQNIDEMEGFWAGFVDQVAFVDYNPWENTYISPVNEIAKPCSDLWRRTFVWFDGTVNPCDVDYKSTLKVGNVATESLQDMWTGGKYSELRNAHLEQRRQASSPCNRCTVI